MAIDNSTYHDTKNIISQIKLPNGTVYEVHDADAIHDVSELGLSAALVFKGTKDTVADLPATSNKVGDVWLVTEDSREYVWTQEIITSGSSADDTLVDSSYDIYAHLASETKHSLSDFIGATVETNDAMSGDRTIVITDTHVADDTVQGCTFNLGNYCYIYCAYSAGYKNLPAAGTYLSYSHAYDSPIVKSLSFGGSWEGLGGVYNASSSTHYHTVTVTGTNSTSTVTGNVVVPTVSSTKKYISASMGAPTVTPTTSKVLGADTAFTVSGGSASTTKLKATADGVAVAGNGTAKAVTGFGAHTTANAITALNTTSINNPTASDVSIPNVTGNTSVTASKVTTSNVSIPNVTGNTSVTASKVSSSGSTSAGKAASWSANVTNGVLSFGWTANTPTAVTLPTFTDVTATNTTLGDALSASKVTATDVSASKVTLGTALSASKVTTSEVTVATGSKSTAAAITALGALTTSDVLTGVKVTSQPSVTLASGTTGDVTVATGVSAISVAASGGGVDALTGVAVSNPGITMSLGASQTTGSQAIVSDVTTGTSTVELQNGTAAAQTWTQVTGTTGQPK